MLICVGKELQEELLLELKKRIYIQTYRPISMYSRVENKTVLVRNIQILCRSYLDIETLLRTAISRRYSTKYAYVMA